MSKWHYTFTYKVDCLNSISLALVGEMALNLCVIEYLYEACPLSRPSDLSVSYLMGIASALYIY
jgi:hypothetical protein